MTTLAMSEMSGFDLQSKLLHVVENGLFTSQFFHSGIEPRLSETPFLS